ncbi:hypothetical protein [Microbacterium maritypicum]|uniref:hypothetical protein n=1 Tax=Microbacterium maritypicum TaxID=33918 RepID=UPI003A93A4FB
MNEKLQMATTRAYLKLSNKVQDLRENEDGLETAEKVFLVVGSIILAAAVIAGITVWVNGQIALLPTN